MKKAKTFQCQKLARKIKTEAEPKKAQLIRQLAETKKINHTTIGVIFLWDRVVKLEEYLCEKLEHLKPENLQVAQGLEIRVLEAQSLKTEASKIQRELTEFIKKLYHEDKAKVEQEEPESEAEPAEDYFVGALNQNEDASEDESTRSPVPEKRKKNRLGQRARRELWEKQFGDKANHVKKAKRERLMEKKQKAKIVEAAIQKPQAPAKDLHPSWAAKLAQKQRATTSTTEPERIVFD